YLVAGLLEHPARGRRPRGGHVADPLRLSGGQRRYPLDVALARSALERAGDRLQRLLVRAQRRLAGRLALLDDALVELADTLRDRLDPRVGCVRGLTRAGTGGLRAARRG